MLLACSSSDKANGSGGPKGIAKVPSVPGEVDPGAPPGTSLPPLPRLVNVRATAIGDSVQIAFDPIDGALDYRVYELPTNDRISSDSNGFLTVQNAVYRCAGNRQAPAATLDGAAQVQSGAIHTLVDGQNVYGYTRSLDEATLGYVYAEPGDGRIPVYALGEHDANADNDCYFQRWGASRSKQYTTSSSDRDMMLAQGFRDDGIAFYVPAAAGSDTVQISTVKLTNDNGVRLYFPDGPEAAMRQGATPAFFAVKTSSDAVVPLKRVFYANICGQSHDELVATDSRFQRARMQGDKVPLYDLHWSGLTAETTLVVEALDQVCPYQEMLAPKNMAAYTSAAPFNISYEEWITPADAQAKAATGEIFINGQADGMQLPRPMARSFIKISPAPAPDLDWSYGFNAGDTLGPLADDADCGALDGNCFGQYRQTTDSLDVTFVNPEPDRYAQSSQFGELWVMYSDLAADTNGKFRLTPTATRGDMTADSFLYATMEVDSFSTARRYPQIIISDQDVPVQVHLPMGNNLVFQIFHDWPNTYEMQICDHKNWDVNDQCPVFDFHHERDPADPTKFIGLYPGDEPGEHFGMDRSTRYEVYVSTQRAYLLLDGQPYGCANLPAAGVPSGSVTVTFGDVLYHSGVDQTFDFTKRHMQVDSLRHFDNLGFKSHVAPPTWDESRFPCTGAIQPKPF